MIYLKLGSNLCCIYVLKVKIYTEEATWQVP